MVSMFFRNAAAICVAVCSILHSDTCIGQGTAPERLRLSARSQISSIAKWIPPASETLTVIREPYRIPETPPLEGDMTSLAQSTYERILKDIFEYGKNGNTRYGDKARNRSGARDLVTNRVADLYVEAGSNFRMTDIGPKRLVSDTCYVLAFRKGFANKLDILIPRLLYNRGTIHHINGTDVIEYKPRRLRKLPQTDSYWITMPQPNTLVIATRMSLLTRVLGDPTPNSPAVFPETLKAWDHISPSSKAWGLRHYTENVAATDISDVRVLSLGSEGADNDTLGTVSAFAFDLNAKTGSGRAVWLDCDRSVSNFVVESFKHRVADIGGEYTESPNGTVAMSITWSDDAEGTKTSMRLARWISWFMGHAGII